MTPSPTHAPRIWVLLGSKAGDNAQMLTLAEHLQQQHGLAFATRQLRFRRTELLTNLLLRVTLAGIDPTQSDQLASPWPELIITSGRRNEPVARWIKQQCQCRVVHLGRPWSSTRCFDLIVSTPQYQLPDVANVMTIALPLARHSRRSDCPQQTHHPKRLVVLVGGDSGAQRLNRRRMSQLAGLCRALAAQGSAEILVATSPRTSPAAAEELQGAIAASQFFAWHCDRARGNPYRQFLTDGDAFVVTSDSVSMLADALATARPVHLFDLLDPRPTLVEQLRYRPLVHALAQHLAPRHLRRDVRRIHEALISAGMLNPLTPDARWIDAPQASWRPDAELEATGRRVVELLQSSSNVDRT